MQGGHDWTHIRGINSNTQHVMGVGNILITIFFAEKREIKKM